jgi:uncharacterized protein (TIRG00374 family)
MSILIKKFSLIIKIFFSVISILVILNYLKLNNTSLLNHKIGTAPILIAAIFPLFINPIVSNKRWQLFLKIYNVQLSLVKLIKISFKSFFLSLSLPSSLGFDAMRVLLLSKEKGITLTTNGISVFLDRFLALFVMLLISFFASIALFFSKGESYLLIVSTVLILLQTIFYFSLKSSLYLKIINYFFANKKFFPKIHEFLLTFFNIIKQTELTSIINFKSILYIVSFQLSNILCTIFIFFSLDVSVPFYIHFTLLPIIWIVTIIPISISGLGLREGAFIFFYGQYGINETDSFLASILSFVILILFPAFIGLFILLFDRKSIEKT